jgi:PAS domain S-box-containing protein
MAESYPGYGVVYRWRGGIRMTKDPEIRGKGASLPSVEESAFAAIFENSHQPTFIADVESEDPETFFLLAANRAAINTYGYSMEELRRMRVIDLHLPADREVVEEMVRKGRSAGAAATRTFTPVRHVTKDGTVLNVDVFAHRIRYQGRLARLAIIQDVTGRVQAEEQLRVHSIALEAASEAIHIVDLGGKIIFANSAAETLFGYSREDQEGMLVANLHTDPEHAISTILAGTMAQGAWNGETDLRRKDGSAFPASLSTSVIPGDDGQPRYVLGIKKDISEKRERESALRESEERYRMLVENSQVGVGLVQEGRIVFMNQRLGDMLGYTIEEMAGTGVLEHVHPEDVPVMAENMQKRMEGLPAEESYVVRGVRKDGETITAEIMASVVQWKGAPATLASLLDITEKAAIEKARSLTEVQYRAMFEAQSDAVFIVNREGIIADVNPAACSTYGYECDDLKGRPVTDLIDPAHHHIYTEAREKLEKGETYHNQSVDVTSEGRKFHTDVQVSGFLYGGTPHALVVARDITDLREAQEAVRQSGESLRDLIDNVRAGIMVVDPEGHVVEDVNIAASEMIGAAKEEIIGRRCHRFICPTEEGSCPITDLNETVDNSERILLTADGREMPVLRTVTRINLMGKPRLLESFVDIRDLKKAEGDLMEVLRDLRAKNEEMEAFVYTAAHDLRTPLVSVIGYLDLLKGELAGKLDTEQDYMLGRVAANTIHFDNLLKDLLVFSQSGVRETRKDKIRIASLVERIVEEERVGEMSQAVEVSVSPGLPELHLPGTRAYQVFKNLVSNSLKFGKAEAPLKVEVGKVRGSLENGFAEFYVRDNGIGIEPQMHEEIFRLFYRTRKQDAEGTGVGLAIVKRIVEGEGGHIRVESDRGSGTAFYFTLPVVAP